MVFTDLTSGDHETKSSPIRYPKALLLSITTLLKRAGRASKKLKPPPHQNGGGDYSSSRSSSSISEPSSTPRSTPRSPFARPKQLVTNLSDKAMKLVRRRKEEGGFGDGGVWRKQILMGGKCEPLDFSGVIYYDENGNKLNQLPLRSPRASPMPGYLARRDYA